jgi:hypothetical protein
MRHSAHFLQQFAWPEGSFQKFSNTNLGFQLKTKCSLHTNYSNCSVPVANQYTLWVSGDAAKTIVSGPVVGNATGGTMKQFGHNITANGTICGDAPVVATATIGLGASSAQMCQELCSNTSTCAFFNYEYEKFEPYEIVTGYYTGLNGAVDWLIVAGTAISCTSSEIWSSNRCQTCGASLQPNKRGDKCIPCPAGHAGSDGRCERCENGKQPNKASSACESCPAQHVTVNGDACQQCEFGKEPNSAATECVCLSDRYDRRYGLISCFDQDYVEGMSSQEVGELAMGYTCIPCPPW